MSKKGDMLATMLLLAVNGHAGQFDKGGHPYVLHPLKVLHYLKTDDEELQCIALGHDLFEDTAVTKQLMRERGISERVIDGIWCMTKLPGETPAEYEDKVLSNVDTMRVKKCDLRHNSDIRRLKGVTDKDIARVTKYMKLHARIDAKLAELAAANYARS